MPDEENDQIEPTPEQPEEPHVQPQTGPREPPPPDPKG